MLDTLGNFIGMLGELEIVIIDLAIIICDMVGVVVLLTAVYKGIVGCFRKAPHVKLTLAQGIALALEFKLAAEVLRTVTVRDWSELVILGTIVLLRGAITLLIHWEIKSEKVAYEQELKKETQEQIHNEEL